MSLTQIAQETMWTLLRRHKKSQAEVALMLGRSRDYVAARVQGREAWDTDEISKVAAWLGEDEMQFFTGIQYELAKAS